MSDEKRTAAPSADEAVEAASVNEVPDAPETAKEQQVAAPTPIHVNIPTSAFKRIKTEAREKGKQEGTKMANKAFEEAAKAAGFESVEAAFSALASIGSSANSSPAEVGEAQPSVAPTNAEMERHLSAQRELERKAAETLQRLEAMQSRAAELEEALTAKDAEIAIRDSLAKAGVKDTDYAATLLARTLAAMDDDELAAISDVEWVDAQRKNRPYLFGEDAPRVPATTGVNESTSAPSPEQVAEATAGAGNFDARAAKPDEFRKRLAALGLNIPGYGARA